MYDRKTDEIFHKTVSNLAQFLPKNSALIFNNTKVIKARIFGTKPTGGKIELLFIRSVEDGYLTQIRGKVHLGDRLHFEQNLSAVIVDKLGSGELIVRFFLDNRELNYPDLIMILEKIGHTPLPPYIKRPDTKDDETSYQTCFASSYGSVAAPTASLHFDSELLHKVRSAHSWAELTLHVGLGTFKGVEASDIRSHQIHSESYQISQTASDLIASDKPIVAIGTTACRTIEHFVRTKKPSGECDLFLHPNNKPVRVNHLLTNFHLPKSTLIMLVAAFVGVDKTKEIYNEAISQNYRFFSYGDAMLII